MHTQNSNTPNNDDDAKAINELKSFYFSSAVVKIFILLNFIINARHLMKKQT